MVHESPMINNFLTLQFSSIVLCSMFLNVSHSLTSNIFVHFVKSILMNIKRSWENSRWKWFPSESFERVQIELNQHTNTFCIKEVLHWMEVGATHFYFATTFRCLYEFGVFFIYLFIYLFVYLFIYLCIYLFIIFIEGREGRQNFKILFCF